MSLASLPHSIPFKLGGLLRPTELPPYGLTGNIPARIPFNLSTLTDAAIAPLENIGWELICRAYNDFQTVLLRTTDMTALTFSKELNAVGAASFSLNLEHNLFKQALHSGYTVETLFDYENLWEICYNGTVVFQALGTAINESIINAGESRTVTVNGSGIGKVLEWASVYPVGFPGDVTVKLEDFVDSFSGDQINMAVWGRTNLQVGMNYTGAGMRDEADAEFASLTQERTQLQTTYNNAITNMNTEKQQFAVVAKDPTSTDGEISAALKQYNAAKDAVSKAGKALNDNQALLDRVIAIRNFIGPLPEEDNFGHLRLTLYNAGTNYMTSSNYDIGDSGISFGVEPAPSANLAGQIVTQAKIFHRTDAGIEGAGSYNLDQGSYARIYTQRLASGVRLYAEVSSSNEVSQEDWAYDVNAQRYWRIREDNGYIIFDTSPDNLAWTQRFRAAYSWPDTKVAFQFSVSLTGSVGIALPLSAYLFELNKSSLPATQTAFQYFGGLLEAAQNRGVITYVKPTYTDSVDSRGIAWIGKPDIEVAEGTKLSVALTNIAQVQQADWIMDTDFTLNVFQKTKDDTTIPPVYFTKENVVFHEGGSQEQKDRTRNREQIANSIVGKNSAGQYVHVEDSDSISKYQRREAFISAGDAGDLATLSQVLQASLQDMKDEKSSWKVVVAFDQPGRQPFKDYDVGDWISIETSDSQGNIAVNQWRVIGIAIQIGDNDSTVELTLQSRMELLAERLKQQVDNLSASSAAGGTSIGSAISAAVLVEQMTLAGLQDVVVETPVEGDVLTYSNGYWIPMAFGDQTIPDPPVITNVYTNVYYPVNGVLVRAQSEVHWGTPTNEDGSFITDGHHYELRYRPQSTADTPATWADANSQGAANNLLTWSQPVIPANTNSGWQTVYVGWDQQSTVIQELTPGVSYELEIRAVDSSTPQHFSDWSDTYVIDVVTDTIPPPQPAPPVVASSTLGVQVTHYLGTTGNQFNLPPDMAYLEVHAGGPAFYPNDTTMIGKVVVNQGLLLARTPAIQTFSIESTEDIWIRVIAVDQTGNKSSPSGAATATINLVDDAHISDLTATKITAGTISSSIILAGSIRTGDSGARAEMNYEGFTIYSEDDDPTVSLLGSPGTNGNFLLIKDLEDPTSTLASIDGTGRGSFQSITVADDITIAGDLLEADILNPIGKGIISVGYWNAGSVVGGGPGVERGFLELSFIAEEARTYMICGTTEVDSDNPGGDRFVLRFRDGGTDSPTIASSPVFQQQIIWTTAGGLYNTGATIIYAGTFTPGLHRILWTFSADTGNAKIAADTGTGTVSPSVFWVEDLGLPQSDTVILNDGGVDQYQAVADPTKPSTIPKPKVTYTKNYSCTWSGTYRSNGQLSTSHGNTMVQGDSGSDTWLNDARSLCGFDYTQIQKDLSGASIIEAYITLYANHWYWNDGGTARIGTHNYTGRPATWSGGRVNSQRISSVNWPKPGRRKVRLGVNIGQEFQSGVSRGIALGPTTGNKLQYGKFTGNGQPYEPVLTIVYVK